MNNLFHADDIYERIYVTLFSFIIYIISSFLLKRFLRLFFDRVKKDKMIPIALIGPTKTASSLLSNSIDIILFVTFVLIILSAWNVNIAPILTSAGIFGLAISFSSQTIIKDVISGVFIIIENQFNVGDMVKIGSFEGKVVHVTLRLVILKDDDKNLIYLPNSQILSVVKYSQEGYEKSRKNDSEKV